MLKGLELQEYARRKNWNIVPMWTIAQRRDRKGYPQAELLSVYREYGVIRKSDRNDNHNVESDDLSSYKFVQVGDLVLNKMKTWQGSLGVSAYEGIVSPAYFVCELSSEVYGPYIHYLLRSAPYIAMYGALSKGIRVGQWDLPYEEFRNIPVLLPPVGEQKEIADFLEIELSQINKIIDLRETQQNYYTELIKSKIDSLLKGDQSTNSFENSSRFSQYNLGHLKNFGANNLIMQFKQIFEFVKETYNGPEPKVLSLTKRGVVERDISNNEGQFAASYETYALASAGNFVLNPMDLRAGSVAVSNFTGVVSNAYFVFRIKESMKGKVDSGFCELLLRWHYQNDLFYSHGSGLGRPEAGGGGRWTISRECLGGFPLPMPPLNEQIRIRSEYQNFHGTISEIMELLDGSVKRLRLLKQSIITYKCIGLGVVA
jgi:type I restriction enzyme S subunit